MFKKWVKILARITGGLLVSVLSNSVSKVIFFFLLTETVILNYLTSFSVCYVRKSVGYDEFWVYCDKDPEGNCQHGFWYVLLLIVWLIDKVLIFVLLTWRHIFFFFSLYKLIVCRTGWLMKSIAIIFGYLVTSNNLRNWVDDFRIIWHYPVSKSCHVLSTHV